MILKYMYFQIRNLKIYSPAWNKKKTQLCLEGEAWAASHVSREYDCIWSMTCSIKQKFTFSFIKGTCAHYVQFEDCTVNILVNLFKI